MQLPDESVEYHYQALLTPSLENWTPLVELQAQHLLPKERLRGMTQLLMQVRGEVAAERDLQSPPPERQPLHAGFIDLPQKTLDNHRRKGDQSELGRVLALAQRLRDNADRVVILGVGGSYLGPKAIFDSLCHTYHNELPGRMRMGKPCIYFEGNGFDNDATQDLLELLENTCVEPENREERWGVIAISKSGQTLETATSLRIFKGEAGRFYGMTSPRTRQLFIPITGTNTRMRELCRNEGYRDEDILTIPDNVGGRFSVFSPAGLLPAAVMGLDVRALLLGAAAMTRRFLEEGFERNPVLQFAAVNHLMHTELHKSTRVLAVWSKKLETLGLWYDQLVAESLGKQGKGPTPLTVVHTRDLYTRGQLHQDGPRDKIINNLIVKTARTPPLPIGHTGERDEDKLNDLSRKGLPDFLSAALEGTKTAYQDVARPMADLVLPVLSEHTIGQVMQMLMLATVVEARLSAVNPYSEPGAEVYRKHMGRVLKGQ